MLSTGIGAVLIVLGRREEAKARAARASAKAAAEGDRPA
jgi:hypothetical protein